MKLRIKIALLFITHLILQYCTCISQYNFFDNYICYNSNTLNVVLVEKYL